MRKTFDVSMGQAFFEALPKRLEALGGRVLYVTRDATEVVVAASFDSAAWTADLLQEAVWATDDGRGSWASCSVGVTETR